MFKKVLLGIIFSFSINIYSYADTNFKNNSIIIYGADKKQEDLSNLLKKNIIKSNINAYPDIKIENDTLSLYNIVLLGYSNSNKIMNFTSYINTNYPFSFKKDYFSFANTFYTNPYNAIAFKYPSPFNPKFYIMIYYSNTVNGLDNLVKKVNLGNKDYIILDENSKIIREGNFQKTAFGWTFDEKLDSNYQKDDISYMSFKSLDSFNFNINFKNKSFTSSNLNNYSKYIENYLNDFNRKTKLNINEKFKVYVFNSKEEKNNYENFYKKDGIKEIYTLYNKNTNTFIDDFSSFIYSNYLSVIKKEYIKKAFIEFSKDLYTDNLKNKCLNLDKQNKIPSLLKLIKGNQDTNSTIILGSFTKYLIDKYGIENYSDVFNNAQNLNTQNDLLKNISDKLDISFSRLEKEWKYHLYDK